MTSKSVNLDRLKLAQLIMQRWNGKEVRNTLSSTSGYYQQPGQELRLFVALLKKARTGGVEEVVLKIILPEGLSGRTYLTSNEVKGLLKTFYINP